MEVKTNMKGLLICFIKNIEGQYFPKRESKNLIEESYKGWLKFSSKGWAIRAYGNNFEESLTYIYIYMGFRVLFENKIRNILFHTEHRDKQSSEYFTLVDDFLF